SSWAPAELLTECEQMWPLRANAATKSGKRIMSSHETLRTAIRGHTRSHPAHWKPIGQNLSFSRKFSCIEVHPIYGKLQTPNTKSQTLNNFQIPNPKECP